ncbi:hypothetical protein [Iningainema tapete]|uniref:Uncharacterized protein n=1 Tax=Iningainema tapete BLCC-T55 TaxID=2748662 RepID=A0A8J6XH81_9CYAN|nr:hypothetical protein [Iningainema tapete]MBD2772512.1 hypothetical protein [Iningainema tapete BLCC-T55]
MSSSNSTVDLNTLDDTLTHNSGPSEQVASETNVQNPLSREDLLSEAEVSELRRLEIKVELGLKAFWEIGQALSQIRDQRLYRENYKTFEEYCITRWEISRRSAYQLIGAAMVVENVRNCAQILPLNEAQARPLTALPPEQQREAWKKAVSTAPSGKVTAVHVAQVAREYHKSSAPPTPRNKNTVDQQVQLTKNSTESVKCCWNCAHCSHEFIDNPHNFYCYQLGKLNFVEKDGYQRGAECELWTYRGAESDEIKKTRLPLRETFSLTLQLPAYLQSLMQDAAKESGLVVVDWAAKVLEEAIFASHAAPRALHQDFIDVSVSEVA